MLHTNMLNLSEVSYIHLTGYHGMEKSKELYFILFLFAYLVILVENAALIGVICVDRSLHEPMYILLCDLAVNSLYGGTAVLPALLSNLLSRSKEIPLALCQTQTYAIHTYAITEFTILAAMSYDRYMAICFPLTYHPVMSQRVFKLVVLTWLFPLAAFFVVFGFTLRMNICRKAIDKVYCLNYLLVQLSCTDTPVASAVGLLSVALYTLPQIMMVLYSYAQILRICVKSCARSRRKALKTCVPHLVSIGIYSLGCFFEIASGRIKNTGFSYQTKLFLALYFLIFPPILNPVIYGLSMQVIRVKLVQVFSKKKNVLM